jgi:surface polysaccharide O-acyltransferase-like enzyme
MSGSGTTSGADALPPSLVKFAAVSVAAASSPPISAPVAAGVIPLTRARRVDIEALRIVAAVMIVVIHGSAQYIQGPEHAGIAGPTYWVALLMNMASRSAVCVFFAISGWALLARSRRDDEVSWLWHRLVHLATPLLLWDVFYAVETPVAAAARGGSPLPVAGDWLTGSVQAIVFGPGTKLQLWFMYYLIALTIVFWLIRVAPMAIADRRTMLVFVGAAMMLTVPYGVAPIFGLDVSWSGFGYAFGYAALGYVLFSVAAPPRWLSAVLVLGSTAALVMADRMVGHDGWELANAGPLYVLQTIGVIGLVRTIRFPDDWQAMVRSTARLTFGVYFVHTLVQDVLHLTIARAPVPVSISLCLTTAGAIVLSFALVALWHRIRVLQFLMG